MPHLNHIDVKCPEKMLQEKGLNNSFHLVQITDYIMLSQVQGKCCLILKLFLLQDKISILTFIFIAFKTMIFVFINSRLPITGNLKAQNQGR